VAIVRVIAALLALAGLAFLATGWVDWRDRSYFFADAVEAAGEVTEVPQRHTTGYRRSSTYYAFRVRFPTADGRVIQEEAMDSSSSPRFSPGDKVVVRYSRERPEWFRIDQFALSWGDVVIELAAGLGLVAAGLSAFWIAGGSSPRGVKMEARLPEIARAWREGRLTRDSPYQALLVAFAFVFFPLLAAVIAFLLLAPPVLQLLLGIALAAIAFGVARKRRSVGPSAPGAPKRRR